MNFPKHAGSAAKLIAVVCVFALLSSCKDKDRDGPPPEPFPPSTQPATVMPSQPIVIPPTVAPTVVPDVRVAVLKDAATLRISAPASGARIVLNGKPWRQLAGGTAVTVTLSGNMLLLEGQPAGASSARFESFSAEEPLKLNDRESAGRLTVSVPAGRAGMLAIAQLSLEEYLAGVLAGEVPYERWHPEALKAQAVVSRTYALHEIRGHAGDAYDVETTVMSQVFRGGYKNVPVLNAAISATRGQVLTSGGAIFPTYFHSTCGGHTEGAGGIFPEFAAVKPLCGVTCPYCGQSPSFRWRASFSKDTIAAKLRGQVPTIGKIESFAFIDARGQPVGNSPADLRRVQSVSIKHSNGVSQMQGNAFRLAVSPKEMKSLLFGQVVDTGETLEIGGGGFGHGVGMCQYGSQGMATAGQPYASILGFYYPGAALTRLY